MTRLFNDPVAFTDEMIAGFAAAHSDRVTAVTGGVVRATVSATGGVAVVIGGGSGHYPAFGGLVGAGLAHGAAMGNVFASPSRQQVHSVARAAEHGGGVLLTYGNYAGDVLNFDAAEEQLRSEGIDCRTVLVTDDISSAPASERGKRRGIAGDLTVFKIAGAAAEAGYSLDDVERVARHANDRTRTIGVAFTGCTLPGADAPLFTIAPSRMAVGLGIHGEPGIDETDVPTADELAALFVDALLAELPDGIDSPSGQRVAVVLNGLGAVKYEELFVVYRRIDALLVAAGLTIVEPDVGEFCTSFDMAGASLTLLWLDDELEQLWRAPADSPAYCKGSIAPRERRVLDSTASIADAVPIGSPESRDAAAAVLGALEVLAATIDANADELGRIDAVAGDGDHGIGMQRGARAAVAAARPALEVGAGAATLLAVAADAWSDRAGGTSGALWGVALRGFGGVLGNTERPTATTIASAASAALDGIRQYGKAEVGDKTMVDAISPFVDSLVASAAAGLGTTAAWVAAAGAAEVAAVATADLLPRMGRARPHAEKSLGTPDAGATSFALIVAAIARHLTEGHTS